MYKVDIIYNDVNTDDLSELAFISFKNFIMFHKKELLAVENGEKLYDYFYQQKASRLTTKGILLNFKDDGIKIKKLTCVAKMVLEGMI
jgi:hypothetical protein